MSAKSLDLKQFETDLVLNIWGSGKKEDLATPVSEIQKLIGAATKPVAGAYYEIDYDNLIKPNKNQMKFARYFVPFSYITKYGSPGAYQEFCDNRANLLGRPCRPISEKGIRDYVEYMLNSIVTGGVNKLDISSADGIKPQYGVSNLWNEMLADYLLRKDLATKAGWRKQQADAELIFFGGLITGEIKPAFVKQLYEKVMQQAAPSNDPYELAMKMIRSPRLTQEKMKIIMAMLAGKDGRIYKLDSRRDTGNKVLYNLSGINGGAKSQIEQLEIGKSAASFKTFTF